MSLTQVDKATHFNRYLEKKLYFAGHWKAVIRFSKNEVNRGAIIYSGLPTSEVNGPLILIQRYL
ncbi:hypothetical protein [Pedobacter agri]|uniref:hypothetical protein n=1 Tax=Pedobacter agri TaxID=454586 RepID=UPI00292F2BE3|nr:hypothetical protein [Pedobacter agri]